MLLFSFDLYDRKEDLSEVSPWEGILELDSAEEEEMQSGDVVTGLCQDKQILK